NAGSRRAGQNGWEKQRGGCGAHAERLLGARHAGIGQRIKDGGVDDAAVVDAVSATYHRLTVAREVIGKAEPRAEVVLVLRHMGGLLQGRIDHCAEWIRQSFTLIPHAQRKAEPGHNLPVVRRENGVVGSVKFKAYRSKRLAEIVVAGQRKGSAATMGYQRVQNVIVCAAIAVAAELGAQVLRIIVNAAVVHTELQVVLAL